MVEKEKNRLNLSSAKPACFGSFPYFQFIAPDIFHAVFPRDLSIKKQCAIF